MDPIITGAAANLSSDVPKGIFQEAKRHIRRVISYQKNVEKFQKKIESLMAKRQSVRQDVEDAERNVETMKADVELWCNRVDEITNEEEKKKVKDLEDKAKSKCFIGLCPNIMSRYRLSKKVEEAAAAVDDLLQQGHFDKVAFRDVPEIATGAPPKDFKAFDSRKEVFDQIMGAVKDSTVSVIGVYGAGGVGKTTLITEAARQVQELSLFGSVVKATVTVNPDIQKIQDQIAESLSLKLEEGSIPGRAHRLLERLKKEKKILIVLDDIWVRLDLTEVGIPFGDQHKGCKLLLTSRNRDVLVSEMDAEKTFAIGVLEEREAWDLFKKMVGEDFQDPELLSVASEVAKKCEGSPLAVVTVARALRKKDLSAWKDASLQLHRPSPSNFTGVPAAIYVEK